MLSLDKLVQIFEKCEIQGVSLKEIVRKADKDVCHSTVYSS